MMISEKHSSLWQFAISQLEVRWRDSLQVTEVRGPAGRGALLIRSSTFTLHFSWAIACKDTGAFQEEKICLYILGLCWKARTEVCRVIC
jgi:hypothetical protein